MTKIRTNAPTTVYIVRAAGTAPWAVGHGFTQDHSLTGVSFKGQRAINRAGPASEWQDTRHKEWDPSLNTEDEIPLTEVLSKSFPAGTISIPGNDGRDGSFLIFIDRPSTPDLWGRHMEELGELKCNNNVDLVYVASQAECQAVAVTAGHPFYSYRHNGEGDGRHKCMSSAHCDSPLDNRGNDWAVYVSPDHTVCQVLHNQDIVAGTFAHYGADRMGAAASDAECSALCTASPECTAWVRQPSSGNCWLTRQSVPVFEADTDRNTGLRCAATLGATSDGCPADNSNTGNYNDGPVGDMSGELIPFSVSQSEADTASVRCCSADGAQCESASLQGGCPALLEKTFAEAHQVCAANGMRLCTRAEMDANTCCGTGCWFNHHAVWVSE